MLKLLHMASTIVNDRDESKRAQLADLIITGLDNINSPMLGGMPESNSGPGRSMRLPPNGDDSLGTPPNNGPYTPSQSNLEGESLGDEPPPLNGGSGSSQSNLEGDSLGGEPSSSNIHTNPPPIPDPPLNGSGSSQSNLEGEPSSSSNIGRQSSNLRGVGDEPPLNGSSSSDIRRSRSMRRSRADFEIEKGDIMQARTIPLHLCTSDIDRKVLVQFLSSIQCLPEWCTDYFDRVEMEFHLSTEAELMDAPQQLRHLYSRGVNHIVQLNTLRNSANTQCTYAIGATVSKICKLAIPLENATDGRIVIDHGNMHVCKQIEENLQRRKRIEIINVLQKCHCNKCIQLSRSWNALDDDVLQLPYNTGDACVPLEQFQACKNSILS